MSVRSTYLGMILAAACAGSVSPAMAQEEPDFTRNKTFDEMTSAEHTKARAAARDRKLAVLRVCADPGNMPLSDEKAEGFQNKIAAVLADDLGAKLNFFWRPYHERGLTRETFQNNECDILMDMPFALQDLLTTEPIYRTTYVFAVREDSGIVIKGLDDPILNTLRIGVFQHSGLREALERRGHKTLELHIISYDTDLEPEHQPWQQVQKVIDGKLDVAGVWGPFAGWLRTMKHEPITLLPVNLMEEEVPLEFDMAIGMQRNQVMLKYMLDWAISRKKDEIAAILKDYGVPLVQCSRCAVEGDLPAHGSYYDRLRAVSQDRFLKQADPLKLSDNASPDQVVDQARLEAWLAEGKNPTEELANAVLGDDIERARFLIGKGADVNARDAQGSAPIHTAARNRLSPMVALLAESGADVNARDSDGFTALLHAINRNHVPTIEMLDKKGANLDLASTGGIAPLTWAIGDGKFYAAKALIDLGADPNSASGPEKVTPLMTIATQRTAQTRSGYISQGPAPLELARALLEKGARANDQSTDGVTALMVAAGANNAPLIGLLTGAGADASIKSKAGQTALDVALAAREEAAIGALKFLAPSADAATAPGEVH